MTRAPYLAGAAALIFAAPVAAQSMDHGSMPGMTMPQPPKKPAAKLQRRSPAPRASQPEVRKPKPVPARQPQRPSPASRPDAEAMPGMDHSAMPGMKKDTPPAPDPDCPPEHARMGHCTPKAGAASGGSGTAIGTDLPAGDAAAPAAPRGWYADRIYSAAEMNRSRRDMMRENGGSQLAFLLFNLAEYRAGKGKDGFRWDAEGWYGGDIDRLTLKSEGEGKWGERVEQAELQLLYSRAIGPFFNLQAGVRQDLGQGPDRTYAVVGFEGLAPYWFEVEGALFLSNKGEVSGRLEGYYDQRITQRLILQPMAEVNFALQDVPETGTGSGLTDVEFGLRLRYELVKEFAPYVGVTWAGKLGDTARFARAAGERPSGASIVIGLRAWF